MPAYKKGECGNPKGRPKGSDDKRRHYYDMHAALVEAGHDPRRALIRIAIKCEEEGDLSTAARANRDIIDKYMPTLKSVEYRQDDDQFKELAALKIKMVTLLNKNKLDH